MVLVVTADKFILRRMYLTGKNLILRADHKNIEEVCIELSEVKKSGVHDMCFTADCQKLLMISRVK